MDLGHFQTGLDDCSWRWPWTTILSGTGKRHLSMISESEKLALGWLHRNLMRCSDRQHTHPALWMQLLNFAASSHNYAMCQCHKIPKIVFCCCCCSCCCCSSSNCPPAAAVAMTCRSGGAAIVAIAGFRFGLSFGSGVPIKLLFSAEY